MSDTSRETRPDGDEADRLRLEGRIRAVPFRDVPAGWRPVFAGVDARGSVRVPAGSRFRGVLRDLLPGPWAWRLMASAWVVVLVLHWDAGRTGPAENPVVARLSVARIRAQVALRRDSLAGLVEAAVPEPSAEPRDRWRGPRSSLGREPVLPWTVDPAFPAFWNT